MDPGGKMTRPAMAKKKRPSRHLVRASVANMELAKAGSALRLELFASGAKIGELEVVIDQHELGLVKVIEEVFPLLIGNFGDFCISPEKVYSKM